MTMRIVFCGLITGILCLTGNIFGQDPVQQCINDINSGAAVFYSQEAQDYFAGHPGGPGGIVDKDAAIRTFRAVVKLADIGPKASAAIPVLISRFPQGIHVMQVLGEQYSGEGTIDDWVSTYIMSEKNQFMLSSPFLDYNTMSRCEQYIETSYKTEIVQKGPGPKQAKVNIYIILTLDAAALALSSITGQDVGTSPDSWRQWWNTNQAAYTPHTGDSTSKVSSASPASTVYSDSGKVFSKIVVGGKYRMGLTTGDDLTGTVEGKTDTSVILETVDGKPYTFSPSLIVRYDVIELPKTSTRIPDSSLSTGNGPRSFTFDDLKQLSPGTMLFVRIKSGSTFTGSLAGADDEMMRLTVNGSAIPISRDIIDQITTVPKESVSMGAAKSHATVMSGPLDTLKVRSGLTDDYGNPKPDLVFVGWITSDDNSGVTMKTAQGETKTFQRGDVVRIIKHSSDNSDEPIRRYAKSLYCGSDMVIVDMPPGRTGRPFFKVCIDKYEFPNKEGTVPTGNISYADAQKACGALGKRLCTTDEWKWGCSGIEGYAYPYGWNVEKGRCNMDGSRPPEASGARTNCMSKFGAYDMAGNIFEWVTNDNNQPALMGGPYSKCQTISPGVKGEPKPQIGLRCCKSN